MSTKVLIYLRYIRIKEGRHSVTMHMSRYLSYIYAMIHEYTIEIARKKMSRDVILHGNKYTKK